MYIPCGGVKMDLKTIQKNIERLIIWRREADDKTQKRINTQLTWLYNQKYLLFKKQAEAD